MEEFTKLGLGWVVKTAHVEYKRPLNLGETILVRTWIDEMDRSDVNVRFEIRRKSTGKLACEGCFDYTLVSSETGRATAIAEWIAQKFAV
jgi:acyl-CoA thioester hydrolase/thioesterase-3